MIESLFKDTPVRLDHRFSDHSVFNKPGQDIAFYDNINSMLNRAHGIAEILELMRNDPDVEIPKSYMPAFQALRYELLDAKETLDAWLKAKQEESNV